MPQQRQYLCHTYPAIAADWHPTANGAKTPNNVTAGSSFMAVWLCHANPPHELRQRVEYRVAAGGCKRCQLRGQLKENNLALKFPHIAKQWHPSKNGDLKPQDVQPMSHKRIWWQCDKDPSHVWQALLNLRTSQDLSCPLCPRQLDRKPDETRSLAARYPEIAAQWHPTKNGKVKPEEVFWKSSKRVWWQCSESHIWSATILSRSALNTGCPYCADYFLTDKNRLSVQFPEIASEWHPTKNRALWPKFQGDFKISYNRQLDPSQRDYGSKRQLRPSDVFAGSQEEVWWQCKKSAEHVWKASVLARTKKKEPCPFCSGRKACSDNNLAVLYPGLTRQWHSRNGSLLPTQVTPSSLRSVHWRCFKNAEHAWEAKIAEVVAAYKNGMSSCPACRTIKPQSPDLQLKSG